MGQVFSSLFGGGQRAAAPAPVAPQKPISPVTNRATEEGIIRKKQRSLAVVAGSSNRSLLNEETEPLG